MNIKSVRVVLDTNILVSACWKSDGLEAQVANLVMARAITACVSAEILEEYRDVLFRPKLAAVSNRAEELLSAIEKAAISFKTNARVLASVDDDDNRFLECAEAAGAQYLITGNLRHYPEVWRSTRIVNARNFLSQSGIGAIPLQ